MAISNSIELALSFFQNNRDNVFMNDITQAATDRFIFNPSDNSGPPIDSHSNPTQAIGEVITLGDSEHHQLKNVLRKKTGDLICVIDGQGFGALGHVKEIKRNHTTVTLCEILKTDPPSWPLRVAVAPPKGGRLQYLIEGLTAWGVQEIVLIDCQFSQKQNKSPLEQAQIYAGQALKQCQRLTTPIISQQKFSTFQIDSKCLLLDPGAKQNLMSFFHTQEKTSLKDNWTLVLGPEGGFSAEEKARFEHSIKLCDHILRIEGAALSAAAIAVQARQALLGE
jgi:16S rRNA (uracil1498-N3)-methyltransferase